MIATTKLFHWFPVFATSLRYLHAPVDSPGVPIYDGVSKDTQMDGLINAGEEMGEHTALSISSISLAYTDSGEFSLRSTNSRPIPKTMAANSNEHVMTMI